MDPGDKAMMKAYPGIYQHGIFATNGVIKTLADCMWLIHESIGFEVLVWVQRSRISNNDTTRRTTWFNLSSTKLPVPCPLSSHDYIEFVNGTVMTQGADFRNCNETSTTSASHCSMANSSPRYHPLRL